MTSIKILYNTLAFRCLKWLRAFIQSRHLETLASRPRHDDVYLVEFPKSGVTWLSFLLGHVNLQMCKLNREITFYNTAQYIPDIHRSRDIPQKLMADIGFRFIKSHAEFNPHYPHVIYLIRQPWDVMKSYFHFMKSFGYNRSFEDFILDNQYGVTAWKKHVEGWLDQGNSSQRIHLIRYEDLMANPSGVLVEIYTNLGIKLDKSLIDKAVELSSFEKMKESESFYREHNPNYSIDFIRSGKSTKQDHQAISEEIAKRTESLQRFYLRQ